MKELRQVCASGPAGCEVSLINDSLLHWQVSLFDWAFDEGCALHRDLRILSDSSADLVPLLVRIDFPDDFPFAPPLVYCASPTLASEYIFDGALCMEMLVDWLPTYGNVETMIVQIAAFLAQSNTRVAALLLRRGEGGGEGRDGATTASTDGEQQREKAHEAYKSLKAFHAKKGWSNRLAERQ